jgi:hypothetical protein
MSKIDHPKVFISYAWTSPEYGQSVLNFANRLLGDGIEVVLDKFEMHPGNEMSDFMEKSVKDPSVTHVLILLNPHYKEKADKREGGVGTETQIISPEVYSNVANTKFIPIIFDRGGQTIADCLPIYLGSRYAIDLTDPDQADANYHSLIRTLCGADLYIKAPLGPKPAWVDQPDIATNQAVNWISKIEKTRSEDQAQELIVSAFDSIIGDLQKIDYKSFSDPHLSIGEKVAAYQKLLPIRNTYLDLLLATSYQEMIGDILSDFFESLDETIEVSSHGNGRIKNVVKSFVHECIIYTLAILFKRKHYKAIHFLVTKPYLVHEGNFAREGDFDAMFYSGINSFPDDLLISYYFAKTGQNKLSGFANYMIENLYVRAVRRDEFVDADILCSNLTAFSKTNEHPWFALTYVYSDSTFSSPLIQKIAIALRSKTLLVKYLPLFGSANENDLKDGLLNITKTVGGFHFGYNQSFASIPFLAEELKPEDVGTKP